MLKFNPISSFHPLATLLRFITRLWQRLPIILRAIVLAELITDVGGLVPDLVGLLPGDLAGALGGTAPVIPVLPTLF